MFTWDDIEVGDYLRDQNGEEVKVIGKTRDEVQVVPYETGLPQSENEFDMTGEDVMEYCIQLIKHNTREVLTNKKSFREIYGDR